MYLKTKSVDACLRAWETLGFSQPEIMGLIRCQKSAKKPRRFGIGSVANAAIKEGLNNAAVLKRVKSIFPDGDTTLESIAWYRASLNKSLRRQGRAVPLSRVARA